MATKTILDSTLTAIANAIRGKTGKSATMTPLEMPGEIAGIMDKFAGIILDQDETTYSNSAFDGAIPAYAFACITGYENALETLLLPNATSVGAYAFWYNINLANVDFSHVASAENYAFVNAFASGSEVSFPALTNTGKDCFTNVGCKTMHFPALTKIAQNMFYGSRLQYITFTHDITTILASAFYNCQQLTQIVFDCDITGDIYAQAFARCANCLLFDFTGCTNVPNLLNSNAFDRMNANAKIVVPDALYSTWIAATNWSTYADKIVKASDYTPA